MRQLNDIWNTVLRARETLREATELSVLALAAVLLEESEL